MVTLTLPVWLVAVLGVLAVTGFCAVFVAAADLLGRAWDWWRDRPRIMWIHDWWYDRRRWDRVASLSDLDCDHEYTLNEAGDYEWCQKCDSIRPLPLPPERTWEQMTSHQLPVTADYDRGFTDGAVFVNKQWSTNPPNMIPTHLSVSRERRMPGWEAEQRQAYAALGLEFPSGLMARVREAAQ